jgi:nucleotide-binding universal stress UspA family protein
MFNNVLIALKEGPNHGPLLELALETAEPSARLHLVTLVRVGTNEDEPARMKQSQARLEQSAQQLREAGHEVTCDVRMLVLGAGSDIVKIASERECDLVVIGLAKRTRVGKALMGSDAQRILLSAECPVIVTRMY